VDFLQFMLRLATDLIRSRATLVAENALLRQQLVVAQRKGAWRRSEVATTAVGLGIPEAASATGIASRKSRAGHLPGVIQGNTFDKVSTSARRKPAG